MALCFHGDKRETLGWSTKFRFQGTDTLTYLCNREQSNSVKLSGIVGLTCGYVRGSVWGKIGMKKGGKTEETDSRVAAAKGDVTANWMFTLE